MSPIDDEFERTTFVPFAGAPVTPASDAIGHYLVCIEGAEPGRRIEIETEPLTLGRDAKQARIVFPDTQVSRLHARIALTGGGVVVENLSATNGTSIDGTRITAPTPLLEGGLLRLGNQTLRYERRGRQEVERARELDRDLLKARNYVLSLLPAPLTTGAVRAEWTFVPSTQLGGDAFGYDWLDPDTFVFYLIDVSGHGVGSAMHSVTVLNVLRQRALPGVDFTDPAQVLTSLNDRFQMGVHDGMLFTMWYGVYRATDRTLRFATAGHHPAYLVASDKAAHAPLGSPALMAGAVPGVTYVSEEGTVPAGSALYLFSDGIFEIVARDDERWELSDFLPILLLPAMPGIGEATRVYRAVRDAAMPGPLDDDVSLLVVTFP